MPKEPALQGKSLEVARTFGVRLRDRRRSIGLTLDQLNKLTGVTAVYISLIERGEANPTLDVIETLSKAVGSAGWELLQSLF